jgi:putative transposase
MKELYKGRYKGITLRAQWWDYGRAGSYFVTFNVSGKICYFGEVSDGKMVLSATGKIVQTLWKEIPERFPYLNLDEFVIMPDHVHGILVKKGDTASANSCRESSYSGCAINRAPTSSKTTSSRTTNSKTTNIESATIEPTTESLSKSGGALGHHNPMLQDTISKAIRWFKGRTTFEIRKTHRDFSWQSRYYDRIIRDAAEYDRILRYIRENPANYRKKQSE